MTSEYTQPLMRRTASSSCACATQKLGFGVLVDFLDPSLPSWCAKSVTTAVPRSGTPSSRRCKPTDADPGKPFRPWMGRPLQEPTPPGLIGFCRLLSVGCTYGYSWTDPSRGH